MIPVLLGSVGGLIGIVVTWVNMASHTGATPSYSVWGICALVSCIVGLVASLLARRWPKAAGIILLIAALGGFISASYSFLPPGVMFIIAAVFSLLPNPQATSLDE